MAKKLYLVGQEHTSSVLNTDEQDLFDSIVNAYVSRREGTLNHRHKTVQGDLATVNDLIRFCNKAPWYINEDDFDSWCYHLGHERNVVPDTQRKYQTAIQTFFTYMVDNIKLSAQIQDKYGIRVSQIVTTENKIPHLTDRQRTNERPAFTHAQIEKVFSCFDKQILEAYKFNSKNFLALQRDKAMFYVLYALGLRNSECCKLDINSFRPNASIPDFGDFGFVTVYGKGSRGTGHKIRTVPVDHPDLPVILEWYVNDVRPHYLQKEHTNPNEQAFFLSERGSRMKVSTLINRFHRAMEFSGLEGLGLTPHSFRHSYTTHGAESGQSLEYRRIKMGHVHGTTTQEYTHCGDEYVAREIKQSVSRLIDDTFNNEEG